MKKYLQIRGLINCSRLRENATINIPQGDKSMSLRFADGYLVSLVLGRDGKGKHTHVYGSFLSKTTRHEQSYQVNESKACAVPHT